MLEVGADVVGLVSGLCFALPSLITDRWQEGLAQLAAKLKPPVSKPAAAAGKQPPAEAPVPEVMPAADHGADDTEVAPDEATALVKGLAAEAKIRAEKWRMALSLSLRFGAWALVLAFSMKLVFYMVRDPAPTCPQGQLPVCGSPKANG